MNDLEVYLRLLIMFGIPLIVAGIVFFVVILPASNEAHGCIGGECGFKLDCVNEVTIEIANENGMQILQQQCLQEGWVRDTPFAEELREAGFESREVVFN